MLVRTVWGVDSANPVTENLYLCVRDQFGMPRFWGRYLSEIPNVSSGLTKDEISFIRSKGIKLLPIYNNFSEAVGLQKGKVAARNAVFHAKRLGIPKNTVLFANVERFFKVDADWIRGWVETIYPTGYRPGFYHDPIKGGFSKAYCQASQQNNKVSVQSILWSAEPESGATSQQNAPKFRPASPNCQANVWLWQYGRDAKECPIDTNLADERVMKFLY